MPDMMNTTQVSQALGITVPTETLLKAGVTVGGHNKRATLWSDDWQTICEKLGAYIEAQGARRPSAPAPATPKPKKVKAEKPAKAAPKQVDMGDDWEDDL